MRHSVEDKAQRIEGFCGRKEGCAHRRLDRKGNDQRQDKQMLKDSGANEVHMRISAPPFKNPCYFQGTDVDSGGTSWRAT